MREPKFDLVVRGRLMLPGRGAARGAVAVRDRRIAAVADEGAPLPAARELDVGDALVLPGGIDVHVHTRSAPDEGIEKVTRAAAAGGVTTIVDMPYDAHAMVSSREAFDAKRADVEREAAVDVALWATVPPDGSMDEVAGLVAAGACAFKLSTFNTDSRRFPRIGDAQLLRAFAAIAAAGGMAGVHAENDEIVQDAIARERAASAGDPLAHARSRPAVAEAEAIGRCLELARVTGVRLHLCHVTIARGLVLAERARQDGVDVSVETCPHYLVLDEDDVRRLGGEAKINPPLRGAADVEALWSGLRDGTVDIVSSDHVGWSAERKHGDDILALASGAPGVELILPLLHDAIAARGLGEERLASLLCEAPARRFGLWPRKGNLLPGADADLVVLDPGEEWTVDPQRLEAACGWSPYSGRSLRGRVRHVFARGEPVVVDGDVRCAAGRGSFVAASTAAAGVGAHRV